MICGIPGDAAVTKNLQIWPSTAETVNQEFKVTIQPQPGKIETNKHFSLNLEVTPSTAAEYELLVDADMPAHRHGMNTKPELKSVAPNQYRVDGMLFHMMGDWVITVTIGLDGKATKLEFPVYVE